MLKYKTLFFDSFVFGFYRIQVNYLRSVVVLVKMRHSTERNYLQSNYAGRAELLFCFRAVSVVSLSDLSKNITVLHNIDIYFIRADSPRVTKNIVTFYKMVNNATYKIYISEGSQLVLDGIVPDIMKPLI